MQAPLYRLPLRLDEIMRKQRHLTCTLKHSIAQHLHLLISTYRGESSYSEDFGCSLWDEEFNMQLNPRWKDNLSASLTLAIGKFEKRLELQEVKVSMEEVSEWVGKDNLRVRKCLHIEIRGMIRTTNEPFRYQGTIFISPLAQQ
jgi:phage baseplate assembly protein W